MTSHETALEAAAYAERLATILHEKYYAKAAPGWKPLTGDIIGLLTQIDNMTAGIPDALASTLSPEVSGLVERLRSKRSCTVCEGDGVKRNGKRCGGCNGDGEVFRYDTVGPEAADALASLSLQLAAAEGASVAPAPDAHIAADLSAPELAERVGEILAKYGLVPHAWDDAGREALEAAASEIIVLARTPPPQPMAEAQSLSAAQEENERLRKAVAGCDWYWPEDDTSSDACSNSPSEIAENCDVKPGDVFGYSRGGVIETRYYAYLPPADDADSDDEFEVDEASEELATAKIAAELERRATLSTPSKEDGKNEE